DIDNIGGGYIAGTVTAGSNAPQVLGGAADETLIIDFAAGASLPLPLIYDGGDGQNGLTFNNAGSNTPHQLFASGLGASQDFVSIVHISRIQNLTLIGGNAGDEFGLRPDASVTIHVMGGPPGTLPGDGLSVNTLTTIS